LRRINLPTRLTLFRIGVVPVIVVLLMSPTPFFSFLAALVFGAGAITDYLDGHLARTTGSVTAIGKLLDPIADKVLILSALIPMVALGRVPAWLATIMIAREFAVTGVRLMAASENKIIAADRLGKFKTGFEIAAMELLLLQWDLGIIHFQTAGMICLLIALVFSLASATNYFTKYFEER